MADYRRIQERLTRTFEKDIYFVTGLTRPGTIWLQKSLDAHPEASCKGEAHFIDTLYPLLKSAIGQYNRKIGHNREMLERAGVTSAASDFSYNELDYLLVTAMSLVFARWSDDPAIKCIGERTPDYARSLDVLARVVPGAKFLHVIRDGRDEAVSAWQFNMRVNMEAFSKKFPDFRGFCKMFASSWGRSVGAAYFYGRSNKDQYMEVCFEDLLRDPGPVVRDVCQFLNIDDSDASIAACVKAAKLDALPDGGIGQWRELFDDDIRHDFQRYAGELLKLLEYED